MVRIVGQAKGVARVVRQLAALGGEQGKQAYAKALTATGFHVRRAMQAEIQRVFQNPTPYIVKSPRVFPASPDHLSVLIAPTYRTDRPGKGGKAGIDPQQILQAQEFGGTRRDKRSEVAFRRRGLLPAGYQTVRPRVPYPGSTTASGDISGSFLSHLLSYLQLQSEQGFKSNMTDKTRRRVHKGTKRKTGRRYFIAGSRVESRFEGGEHKVAPVALRGTAHLAPGVWAVEGKRLKPVLMFVRAPSYQPRLDMDKVQRDAKTEGYLAKRVRHQIYKVLESV